MTGTPQILLASLLHFCSGQLLQNLSGVDTVCGSLAGNQASACAKD